jgi:hypothetical protein
VAATSVKGCGPLGASLGAIGANDFPRQADKYGQAAGDLARSRTDPYDAERADRYLRIWQKGRGDYISETALIDRSRCHASGGWPRRARP